MNMGITPSCHQNLRLERDPRKQANDVISISAAESFDALNTANKRNDVPDISKGLACILQRLLGHQLIFHHSYEAFLDTYNINSIEGLQRAMSQQSPLNGCLSRPVHILED